MSFYGDGKHNENMEHVSLNEFNFYLDQKVTTWMRTYFTVEAETKDEAMKIAIRDYESLCETETWEEIPDVRELITLEDNGGSSTEEIYLDEFPTVMVWNNENK